MTGSSPCRRAAVWQAITELKRDDYLACRCVGKDRIFDIIAWNGSIILALLIRTARKQDIASFAEEVAGISHLARKQMMPGKAQLWLYHTCGRTRYEILAGGAISIRECAA